MKNAKTAVKLAALLSLMILPATAIGYAQNAGGGPAQGIRQRSCVTFEDALKLNSRLRARYEIASPEAREQIRARWEQGIPNRLGPGAQNAWVQRRRQILAATCIRNGAGIGYNGRGGAFRGGRRGR